MSDGGGGELQIYKHAQAYSVQDTSANLINRGFSAAAIFDDSNYSQSMLLIILADTNQALTLA